MLLSLAFSALARAEDPVQAPGTLASDASLAGGAPMAAAGVFVPTDLTIYTATELFEFAVDVNGGADYSGRVVRLGGDIDLRSATWTPIGYRSGSIDHRFRGTFDGDGHTVSGLLVSGGNYVGLFGQANYATIENLTVAGSVTAGSSSGGIVGYAENTDIINCVNNATVSGGGNYVGGVVGRLRSFGAFGVQGCVNNAAIHSIGGWIGGVAGYATRVVACVNHGAVSGGTNSQTSYPMGGVMGGADSTQSTYVIDRCYNTGAVTCDSLLAGGITGTVRSATLTNCYNRGTVTSANTAGSIGTPALAGGVVGSILSTSISGCYNAATVQHSGGSGTYTVGEVYAAATSSTATNNYSSTDTFTVADLGGAYVDDTGAINDGYPVLDWQVAAPSVHTITFDTTDTVAVRDGSDQAVGDSGTPGVYNLAAGTYSYTTSGGSKGSFSVIDSDRTIHTSADVLFSLTPPGASLTLQNSDGQVVAHDGTEGSYTAIPNDIYTYTAAADGYTSATGSLTLIGLDRSITVALADSSLVYNVTVDGCISGGTVTADPAGGTAGTVVTVTVTPGSGNQLVPDSLKYTTDIPYSGWTPIVDTGGVYSFTVPTANVTVTARFEKIPTPLFSVTKAPLPDPVWTVICSATQAEAGDTVQMTVSDTTDTSWATGLVVTGESGATYGFTTITAATGNGYHVNGAGVYSFIMPAEPVTVGFTWETSPLNVYLQLGNQERTLVHAYTRAEMEALAAANTSPIYYAGWNRLPETFMGKAVRYVTIEQLVASAHGFNPAVRYDGPDCLMKGLSIDNWYTNMPWTYVMGTDRYYYAALGDPFLAPENRTGLDREVPPVLAITGWSGGSVYVDNQPYDTMNAYRFWYGLSAEQYGDGTLPTMEERDARCTANNMAKWVTELTFVVAETHTVTADSGISGGTLSFDPASSIAGTTVTITPDPYSGWQYITNSLKYSADGGASYTPITSTEGVYSFTMPDADVVVTARFGDLSVPVSGVTLDKSTETVAVGGTAQLTATVAPANAGNQDLSWSSDNGAVATVNSGGLVKAKAVGEATITVTTEDGGHTAFCLVSVEAGAGDFFTIAVLPDTQFYSEGHPEIFTAQAQWIADNAVIQNIVFAAHLGDIIDDYDTDAQWQHAQQAMDIIKAAGIPYSLVPGNHDVNMNAADTTTFNTYFPAAGFSSFPWYGGGYPEGSNTSSYQLFTAMGQDFVVLDLVCTPTLLNAATEWANSVLTQYSDRKAIVVTHGYIHPNGDYAGGEDVSGPAIRNNIVRGHANVIAVLCGHIDGEYHGTDTGDAGNTVYNLLTNYTSEPNGGNGWLRLYKFYPLENKIRAVTYSPTLDEYQTDSDSEFELDLEQDSHPVTFSSVGEIYTTAVAAAGSQIGAPDDPVRAGYSFGGWYADEVLANPVNFPYTVTGDATLYAKWDTSGGIPLTLHAGWNLVGAGPGTAFPGALFTWNGSTFASTASPAASQGYWTKVASEHTVELVTVSGPHTLTLTSGWNLIGNPMATTAALTLPVGRIVFYYDASLSRYVSTTSLTPGQGAWVKGTAGETVTFGE